MKNAYFNIFFQSFLKTLHITKIDNQTFFLLFILQTFCNSCVTIFIYEYLVLSERRQNLMLVIEQLKSKNKILEFELVNLKVLMKNSTNTEYFDLSFLPPDILQVLGFLLFGFTALIFMCVFIPGVAKNGFGYVGNTNKDENFVPDLGPITHPRQVMERFCESLLEGLRIKQLEAANLAAVNHSLDESINSPIWYIFVVNSFHFLVPLISFDAFKKKTLVVNNKENLFNENTIENLKNSMKYFNDDNIPLHDIFFTFTNYFIMHSKILDFYEFFSTIFALVVLIVLFKTILSLKRILTEF